MKNQYLLSLIVIILVAVIIGATMVSNRFNDSLSSDTGETPKKKIGVLLVNHGSRSETWRNALLKLETDVKESVLKGGTITGITTAFMEYNEPSIATRLKEYDSQGYSDIIIVPIFLTVSPHSFDDIPTIIGEKEDPKSIEMLKLEKIERYTPKAKTHITPLLDFTDILQKNILRRAKALSKNPGEEGVVLIAYGDADYMAEWSGLLDNVGKYIEEHTEISVHSYGWCGHVASYNPDSTSVPIKRVLAQKQTAIVIPVLVAHDEMFQVKIIGDGIAAIPNSTKRILYKPDSILPDENVSNWVITVSKKYADRIQSIAGN